MDLLAISLSAVLAFIAVMHLSWAFGFTWPKKDQSSLARTVVGVKNITKMPPKWQSALVALILLATAFWPLMWRALVPYIVPQGMVWVGMFGITTAFAIRGVAGYLPPISTRHTEQPFASYNARYYSPLCLVLAGAFAALLFYL